MATKSTPMSLTDVMSEMEAVRSDNIATIKHAVFTDNVRLERGSDPLREQIRAMGDDQPLVVSFIPTL